MGPKFLYIFNGVRYSSLFLVLNCSVVLTATIFSGKGSYPCGYFVLYMFLFVKRFRFLHHERHHINVLSSEINRKSVLGKESGHYNIAVSGYLSISQNHRWLVIVCQSLFRVGFARMLQVGVEALCTESMKCI